MAQDDWRIRIELPDEAGAQDLLGRLGLRETDAEELAEDLREQRLAGAQDRATVFVYLPTAIESELGARLVEPELGGQCLSRSRVFTVGWLPDRERWNCGTH